MSDEDYVYDEDSGEWMPASELAAKQATADAVEVRDAVGNLLADGDQVTLIKDLEVKGAGQTLKRGTLIKSIRLTGDPQEIDCKYEGIKGLVLRAEFVRKRENGRERGNGCRIDRRQEANAALRDDDGERRGRLFGRAVGVNRGRLVVWAAALALAGLLAWWLLAPRAAEVETIAVQRGEVTRALAVNGRIRPRQSVAVQSPVAGTLLDLPYDVGDRVEAGTPIARVDDGPQRAAIAEAAAAIAAQEAVLAQARRDYERFAALGEFVSKRQLEEARLAVQEGARELERR